MHHKEKSIIVRHLPIIGIGLIILGAIYYLTGNISAIAMGGIVIIATHLILIGLAAYLAGKFFTKHKGKKNSEIFD